MAVSSDPTDEPTVRRYVDAMLAIQRRLDEPRDELVDLKREARSDGINLEALNLLVPLMAKHEHDRGARVLNEVIRYAVISGAQLDLVTRQPGTPAPPASIGRDNEDRQEQDNPVGTSEIRPPPAVPVKTRIRVAFVGQTLLSVGVTATLLWLLH